jgi:hypothetical protein
MTTFAPTTQIADSNENRFTIGSACKDAAAIAVVGVILLFSITQMSSGQFAPSAPTGIAKQSELRDLLCRIDHRCPSASDIAVREASKARTAENIVR